MTSEATPSSAGIQPVSQKDSEKNGKSEYFPMRETEVVRRLWIALLMGPVLFAHHSTAEYDLTRPASAAGVVTRFEWANPHSHIYLDAAGPDGEIEHWVIEIDGPRGLERLGWSKDSIRPGDRITCSGARAKDGSRRMRCTEVKFADGRVLHSG